MRWLALLGLAALGAQAFECPDDAVCTPGVFVQQSGGPAPPIDPPPIDPEPPPGVTPPPDEGGRIAWEERCELPGTVSCVTWDSQEAVYWSSNMRGGEFVGSGSSPNFPMRNGKCEWINAPGERRCTPAWGSESIEPEQRWEPHLARVLHEPDQWTCDEQYEVRQRLGYSQATSLQASTVAPCWYRESATLGVQFTKHIGGNKQLVSISRDCREGDDEATCPNEWQPELEGSRLVMEYEIMFGPSMFQNPKGSNTAKLLRITRRKEADCSTDRFFDERITRMTPDFIRVGFQLYCAGASDIPAEVQFQIDAGPPRWYLVRRVIDRTLGTVESTIIDVAEGEEVWSYLDTRGAPAGPWRLLYARVHIHQTSGEACTPGVDCDEYQTGYIGIRHVRFAIQ